MKKKIFLFAAVVGLFVLLTGCRQATADTTLKFTDKNGAGTKTITFTIPQDGETVITQKEELDNQGRVQYDFEIYNNSTYFPKGYQAFADFVVSKLPDNGYTATVREDAKNVYIDFTYSFTSYADYAKKTKELTGDRWEEGNMVDPQLYVKKITDEADANFGRYEVVFAESKYLAKISVYKLLEIGFCDEAVQQGVFAPFGDCFENPDCKKMYKDTYATEPFVDFCITQFMAKPDNVLDDKTIGRTYIMEDGEPYEENLGEDGMITFYLTEAEAASLGITETAEMPDSLGKTPSGRKNPPLLDEEGNVVMKKNNEGKMVEVCVFEQYAPQSNSSLLIIIIVAAVVVAAAVVVVAVIIKKRNDEYDDDDDDEDDDEDEDEDDEE